MSLRLPAASVGSMWQVSPVHPREVLPFEFLPDGMAFCCRGVRLGVNQVLKMIHRHPIGKKQQGTSKVNPSKLLGTFPEELLHVRPGKEFQAHRVDLAGLVGWPEVIHPGLLAAHVTLEGMSHLVCEDFDVTPGAIKICIDKGHADCFKGRAEAPPCLSFPGLEVHETAIGEEVEETVEATSHLIEHLFRLLDHPVMITLRQRVALGEEDCQVPGHHLVDSQFGGLPLPQFDSQWGHQLLDGLSVTGDIVLVVVNTLHQQVTKFDIVIKAQFPGHPMTQGDKVIEDLVQLVLVFLEPAAANKLCLVPQFPVRAFGVLGDSREVQCFSP